MTTVPDDPIRAAGTAVMILEEWGQHPATKVLDAAYAMPVHLRRALSSQWPTMTPLDRADLYILRIACEQVEQLGKRALEHDGTARLASILTEAQYFLSIADPTRRTDSAHRARAVQRAADNLAIYERLSEGEQATVLAQLTPPDASTARMLAALPDYIPPLPDPGAGARLEAVLTEAEQRAASEEEPPTLAGHLAQSMRKGLANLSGEWRQQIMRSIGDGVTPPDAIGVAVRAHIRALRHEEPDVDAP
ncbi:hypothetical protein AB0D37_43290 [Streptomyces sp. NPDC048384]|uniref:hypothetical protein n=1 Tax=Streptomyces sp. NPDC048384 TaxID=3155487 RepID=UPI00343ADD73